jgi:hypothetical protein
VKEIEFKLSNKNVITSEDKAQQEKFTFIPVDPDLAKKAKIAISQSIDSDVIESMGLPTEIGDTIIIDFGATSKQQKLTDENKIKEKVLEPVDPGEWQQPIPSRKKKGKAHGRKNS